MAESFKLVPWPESDEMVEVTREMLIIDATFDVRSARALRNWLNEVLPPEYLSRD